MNNKILLVYMETTELIKVVATVICTCSVFFHWCSSSWNFFLSSSSSSRIIICNQNKQVTVHVFPNLLFSILQLSGGTNLWKHLLYYNVQSSKMFIYNGTQGNTGFPLVGKKQNSWLFTDQILFSQTSTKLQCNLASVKVLGPTAKTSPQQA